MSRLPAILLVLLAAGFVAGLVHLFQLRFEAGDVYPPYSTLRADPLGARAFCESLEGLVHVQRDFRENLQPGEGRGTTLFILGVPRAEARYSVNELREIENFASAGGRVVISFSPQFEESRFLQPSRQPSRMQTNSPPSGKTRQPARPARRLPLDDDEDALPIGSRASMGDRWKFEVKRGVAERDESEVYKPVQAQQKASLALPEMLDWHTAMWFDKPDPSWRVIYAREKNRPVMMERTMGGGTLVLASDSYYFSNEALRSARQPELLAWMVGPNREVIFDESHHGIREEPGVASLGRKYRLHGLALALLVLAGLFLWRESVPFLPRQREAKTELDAHVSGRESSAGFVNLLRRNIRASDLPRVCFEEWKKSCARSVPADKLEQARQIIEGTDARPRWQRNPVETYNTCKAALGPARRRTSLSNHRSA